MNRQRATKNRLGALLLGTCAAVLAAWAMIGPGAHGLGLVSGSGESSQRPLALHHMVTVDGHEMEFGQITSVIAGPDGLMYVADAMGLEVLVLSPEGQAVSRLGGRGQGPGDFQQLDALAWAGDRLMALDGRLRRLTLFDRSGRTVATEPFPGVAGSELLGGVDIAYARAILPRLIRAGGPPAGPPEVQFLAIESGGSLTPLTGLEDASFPWRPPSVDCETPDGWIHPLPVPFGDWGPFRAALPGGRLALAVEAQHRIDIVEAASGRQLSSIRRDLPPAPLSDEGWETQPEVRALRELEAERGRAFAARDPQTPCPLAQPSREHYPPIRALISDEEGRLWVEFVTPEGFVLEVMDESGVSAGTTPMPDRDHTVPPHSRGNLLYIVTVDELDVQSIQVYEARFR